MIILKLHVSETNRVLNSILGNIRNEETTECNGCLETSAFPLYPHSQRDLDQYKVKV